MPSVNGSDTLKSHIRLCCLLLFTKKVVRGYVGLHRALKEWNFLSREDLLFVGRRGGGLLYLFWASDLPVDVYAQVLLELKEYASGVDVDFVRKSVRSIGRVAVRPANTDGENVTPSFRQASRLRC